MARRETWEANSVERDNLAKLSQNRNYHPVEVSWIVPPMGWVKCNVDGSLYASTMNVTCAGIFRDEYGRWVQGFMCNLGSFNNALMAKLYEGLFWILRWLGRLDLGNLG